MTSSAGKADEVPVPDSFFTQGGGKQVEFLMDFTDYALCEHL